MHSFTTFFTVSAIALTACAKPVPAPVATVKGFTATGSVARPLPAAPIRLMRAYQKYGADVPDDVAAAAAGTGTAVTTPEADDIEYLTPVTIGGQTVNLDFDTGSADLWVFSSELTATESSGHDIYDPSKSDTSQELQGATWNITYGDGSGASGNVYTDDVEIGGITVTGQAVELASQISAQFVQEQNNDGLLGLSFSSINTVVPEQQTTWFDTGVQQGVFDSNVFTADLKKGAPGTYDFGFIDDSKHTGSIIYTPVNSNNGFWEFTGTGYGIGNDTFKQTSIDAIADTGTTLLLMDDAVVTAYYKEVPGSKYDSSQGGYVFPCSTTAPDFILGIGSGKATIPGALMNLAVATGTTCFGGLQSNSGIGFSIYGDVFLKAIFAVFDVENTQFGFAPKKL